MMEGAPKDNANPVIHEVDQRDLRCRKRPLGWSQLNSLHVVPPAEIPGTQFLDDLGTSMADLHLYQTPEDRAVIHAVMDACEASRGEGVSILRNVGVSIPKFSPTMSEQKYLPSRPNFVPGSYSSERQKDEMEELNKIRGKRDAIEADEIFEIIRNIEDPEHPNITLEQLRVVSREQIEVHDVEVHPEGPLKDDKPCQFPSVAVRFTPTIPHCSQATLIGLSIRVKLIRSLPKWFKIKVSIEPGTHDQQAMINKQLGDKERVAAALENAHLLGIVNKCIRAGMQMQ